MNISLDWKKLLVIAVDVCIGAYLLLAVTAFNKPDEQAMVCTQLDITIEQGELNGFLNAEKVKQLLQQRRMLPVSEPMDRINTRSIEEALEANELIEQAECYTTRTGRVCISIRQRIPIVRVLAANGDDYFVDSKGDIIPHKQYTCNVLVATGAISKSYAKKQLAPLVNLIVRDRFWKSQIVQLNVLDDGSVEMVPRVGEHVAYLGQPVGVERKLDRLRKFYRYGLNQAGWNHYSRVSVEFDNQIICKRK